MYKPNKKGLHYHASHAQDNYTNLGYDYRGNILKKSVSKILFLNDSNKEILLLIDNMISHLVDTVKQVKLHYMISLDKNDRNLN